MRDAQRAVADWEKREAVAEKAQNVNMEAQARRGVQLERKRMHAALARLAELAEQKQQLDAAEKQVGQRPAAKAPKSAAAAKPVEDKPGIEDQLEALKRQAAQAPGRQTKPWAPVSRVDAELEAMKRKLGRKKK